VELNKTSYFRYSKGGPGWNWEQSSPSVVPGEVQCGTGNKTSYFRYSKGGPGWNWEQSRPSGIQGTFQERTRDNLVFHEF